MSIVITINLLKIIKRIWHLNVLIKLKL
ncbi:hypothetical protein Mgra_00000917 [Meloidogyne graminicola]|uniref:Uncharacterized protein n=1 Tax=Meloidogyne graminicola TaxID=189291 RepID=A0A8T0A1X8_9BILA|nr:hypothetical protein Mgra_00000917 [Meloidogyne graminicola]